MFGDIKIKKQKFHLPRNPILIGDVDISNISHYMSWYYTMQILNIVVSNKVPFSKKGLKYYVTEKSSLHRKNLDETRYITFLIKDDELLEKYN